MYRITTLTINLIDRDLNPFARQHQTLLDVPLDNLPLADGHAVLADLVRASGPQPFACRIPDDPRLLTVWQSTGSAAVVTTYWRHKIAHVDLVLANSDSALSSDALELLPITQNELKKIDDCLRPSLVFCKLRQRVPHIADILGMLAYLPVLLDVHPE